MAKFDFNKPVASFSWYLQNGSADDKRGNRLHVGTGQNAQIYFDPKSGEFIGKLKYVDDYIDLADGAKQHFELPRTAREYKPSDFSPKFPISNVKFEVDESVKDFIHVLPRGLFFYQNEFYDAVFGDKTDYPESLKDFLFTRTGDIEAAGEFYGAIEKWPQSVYGTLVEKCNVENRPIPEYENDRALPLDYHKELLASLKDYFGCGESNYRTPGDLIAARSYGSYLSGISLKFNPQDVIAAVEHATFPFCHSNRDSLSLPPLNIWQPPTHARTFPATTPSYWIFRQSASGEAYRSSWDAIRRPDLDSP